MKIQARLAIYIGVAAALLLVLVLAPGAWAEPLQSRHGQTVPTRTPTGGAPPTSLPTATPTSTLEEPSEPPPAQATPDAPEPSAPSDGTAPTAAPTPTATPAQAASPLSLTKIVNQTEVWPGAVVQYTITLTNRGTASVRGVVIEDTLPAELEPDPAQGAAQSAGTSWQGRTLTARRPVLPPGGRMVLTFAARIAEDVLPDAVIVNTAAASAANVSRVTASATLLMPPLELPRTGAGEGCGRGVR